MKFGIREVCNVVFRCKADNTQIGDRVFMQDEPVIYFDTAKTSTMEGSSSAVYAQGGRGNPKLITWEGEKEMTFTFEDALISPMGLSILVGANLISSSDYYHHVSIKARAREVSSGDIEIDVDDEVSELETGAKLVDPAAVGASEEDKLAKIYVNELDDHESIVGLVADVTITDNTLKAATLTAGTYYIVDAYVKLAGSTMTITPDKFSDYFYIEAETLFRRESDGVDKAAQFIIPKGKVQSNFTFTMANSGDPSTFTFTIDAMADYVKFDKSRKVLSVINVIG